MESIVQDIKEVVVMFRVKIEQWFERHKWMQRIVALFPTVLIFIYSVFLLYDSLYTYMILSVNDKAVQELQGANMLRELVGTVDEGVVVLGSTPHAFECPVGEVAFTVVKLDDNWWQFEVCDGHVINSHGSDLPDGTQVYVGEDGFEIDGEPAETLTAIMSGDTTGYVTGGFVIEVDAIDSIRPCTRLASDKAYISEVDKVLYTGVEPTFFFDYINEAKAVLTAICSLALIFIIFGMSDMFMKGIKVKVYETLAISMFCFLLLCIIFIIILFV